MYFHFSQTPKGLYLPEKGSDTITTERIKEEFRGFFCVDCGYKAVVASDEYDHFHELHRRECPSWRRDKIVVSGK